jgi:hypothetical protein
MIAVFRFGSERLRDFTKVKHPGEVGHRWLTPVILDIQEAEIRRIVIQSQPRQIVWETLSQKNPSQKKKGLVGWLKV